MRTQEIEEIKTHYKDLFEMGYEEFNSVGRFVNFKAKGQKIPFEITLWAPRTPWSLRRMVNRSKEYIIKSKTWMNEKAIDRGGDMPADVLYHQNGKVSDLKWYQDGFLHRKNGKPAIIRFSIDGLITDCFWLIDGHDISDKILEFTTKKDWDHLRLTEDQIIKIKENFFSDSNYF